MKTMDKTLKLRAYSEANRNDVSQDTSAKERNISLELEKKTALLEEERGKTLDLLKTIVQLRESLRQEQAKSADMDAKLNKLDMVEESQLVKKNAQLEEEKKLSLEYMRTIEQLRESIKQDQSKATGMATRFDELETKTKALNELESKVKDLSGVLGMISRMAAAGKVEDNS